MVLIGDIACQRGEHEEALRVPSKVQLPAYERLGATQEAAITCGNIASIGYQRSDYEKAADLQRKRLEVNKQLGDLHGISTAGWDLPRTISRERTTSQPSPS